MKNKTIVIANQKGGVGKTTTAVSLASALKNEGNKVLLVDTDPQGNATDTILKITTAKTLYDLLTGEEAEKVIVKGGIDIIPGDLTLSGADNIFNKTGKEFLLKEALAPIKDIYDYIIIDTPPALGILLINALTASDQIIIPIQTERYSVQGLEQLKDTITLVKTYTNPNLEIKGILLTMYQERYNLTKAFEDGKEALAQILNTTFFKSKIRRAVATSEAQSIKQSVIDYNENATTSRDYVALAQELKEKR